MTRPPNQIYLQCYESDGSLRNPVRDDVTWCVDQINENDAIYILATPELAALLERLANDAEYISTLTIHNRCTSILDANEARLRRQDQGGAR